MIKSMTGYGQAEGQVCGIEHVVEIKAVNNRYLRIEARLPEAFSFAQEEVDRALRRHIVRGTVTFVLKPKDQAAVAMQCLDEAALTELVSRLDRIRAGLATCGPVSIDMAGLLNLPSLVRPLAPAQDQIEQAKAQILGLTEQAVERLEQMRVTEGQYLGKELLEYCRAIEQALTAIDEMRQQVLEAYAVRLRRRVDKLLAATGVELDDQTLAREVAVLAEHSDIAEEIARLRSHIEQFRQACNDSGQAGRRLEFIAQEMLREANTMASKATDAQVSNMIVDIKCQIDRIKEQVQNVE
ncbi:MAG: YicC family protein [Sedimentisphaerales bacterium]|jgi:uncharacterized protein (TIGR00255 family)|nr:YicC family protein [Sedimentisphaerales bacterium]